MISLRTDGAAALDIYYNDNDWYNLSVWWCIDTYGPLSQYFLSSNVSDNLNYLSTIDPLEIRFISMNFYNC